MFFISYLMLILMFVANPEIYMEFSLQHTVIVRAYNTIIAIKISQASTIQIVIRTTCILMEEGHMK